MKKHITKILPFIFSVLAAAVLISCSGIQWGKNLDEVSQGLFCKCTFWNEDESISVTQNYIIGNADYLPGANDKDVLKEFSRLGYYPEAWQLVTDGLTEEQLQQIDELNDNYKTDHIVTAEFWFGFFPLTFKVTAWKVGATTYTLQIWKENIENDEYTLESTQVLDGTTEDVVTYTPEAIAGFEPVQPEYTVTLAGDGSTVIAVQYKRKVVTHTVMSDDSWYLENTIYVNNVSNMTPVFTATGKFGAAIDYSGYTAPEKEHCYITGWKRVSEEEYQKIISSSEVYSYTYTTVPELPESFQSYTSYYLPQWGAKKICSCMVNFYIQNADDDNYTLSTVTAIVLGYEGEEITEEQIKSAILETGMTSLNGVPVNNLVYSSCQFPDGTTFNSDTKIQVNAYYNRENFTVTLAPDGGLWEDGSSEAAVFTVRYGAALSSVTTNPQKEGYDFVGWDAGDGTPVTDLTVTEDIVLTAVYKAKTVTIGEGGQSITVNFTTPTAPSSAGNVTYTTSGTTLSFTAALPALPEGKSYTSYLWTVDDGSAQNGESFDFDTSSKEAGAYQVICVAVDSDGNRYVTVQDFTVTKTIDLTGAGA